ncbi:hypothetical protein ONZ51_g7076 [Trametes cubensis]|uniref:BBC1/AIM3 cysteine proteinase-fold domain-containing protein n=1 Tax=Trametes cubensis TaxID=1111947 RepID=A0AAD7TT21_9APHY|nr:hypothetical protein ONZ51_g7076 [Trametes cubensis]
MPTLAELRNKAVKVKNASVSTLSNTKDRMSSQPGKNINWNAEIKPKPPPPPKPAFKPPPPPSRTSSAASSASNVSTQSKPTVPPVPVRRAGTSASSTLAKSPGVNPSPPPRPLPRSSNVYANTSTATPPPRPPPRSLNSTATSSPSPPPPAPGGLQPGPPPPIRRETRPDLVAPAPRAHVPVPPVRKLQEEVANVDRIDWANLSPEDKEAFFGWLDEFFSRYLGTPVGSCAEPPKAPVAGQAPPPIVQTTSRPTATLHHSRTTAPEYITSYPPHPERGSLAEDLAHYFSPSTHWPSVWYGGDDILAPPLRGNGQLNWKGNWSSNGRSKTIFVGVLFADLSMCFYTLTFPQPLPPSHDPNDARTIQRSVRYLPRPQPWDQARLVDAHETYGETVAAFAESFAGTGQFCARGECWDLANEALKSFDQGDILEWRLAKVSRGPYASSTLGNPDHTAVIVSDAVPRTAVADGMSVPPRELGTLVVVEQGVTSPPKRESYDLAQFEEGEVWIYRPGLNTLTV